MASSARSATFVPRRAGAAEARRVDTHRGLAWYAPPVVYDARDGRPPTIDSFLVAEPTPPPFGRPDDPFIKYFVVMLPEGSSNGDRVFFKFDAPRANGTPAPTRQATFVIPPGVPAESGTMMVAPVDIRKAEHVGRRNGVLKLSRRVFGWFIALCAAAWLTVFFLPGVESFWAWVPFGAGLGVALCVPGPMIYLYERGLAPAELIARYGSDGPGRPSYGDAAWSGRSAHDHRALLSGGHGDGAPLGGGGCAGQCALGAGCAGAMCSGGGCVGGGAGFSCDRRPQASSRASRAVDDSDVAAV